MDTDRGRLCPCCFPLPPVAPPTLAIAPPTPPPPLLASCSPLPFLSRALRRGCGGCAGAWVGAAGGLPRVWGRGCVTTALAEAGSSWGAASGDNGSWTARGCGPAVTAAADVTTELSFVVWDPMQSALMKPDDATAAPCSCAGQRGVLAACWSISRADGSLGLAPVVGWKCMHADICVSCSKALGNTGAEGLCHLS